MSEAAAIYWTNTTVKLGDLKPWADNPKTSSKRDARALLKSWDELGQFQTIAIGPGGEVYDGHQRLSALLMVHGAEYEIVARQSSRPLSDDERRKIALYSRQIGAWDWDKLANWQPAELMEWGGMDAETLGAWKRDVAALDNFLKSEGEGADDEKYSRKIEAPIYRPTGEKPQIKELYNEARTAELLAEIEAAELPEDEKEFLRVAARRHTVINFKRVAEYYAHSPAPVQRLMENSALVIIDFERAIELGYVKLSEEIAAQYLKDYPNAAR